MAANSVDLFVDHQALFVFLLSLLLCVDIIIIIISSGWVLGRRLKDAKPKITVEYPGLNQS